MARAIVYTEFGGPEVLHEIEVPDPVAGPGQLVVRVEAAGVNPLDAKLRTGVRASPPIEEPRRVGFDGAGVVTEVGPGTEGFSVGDAVAFTGTPGAYASAVAVDARHAVPRPPGVSAEAGAGIGIPAGTAYQALRSLAVGARDTLLVHGGSGAVGRYVVQFARLFGARVIATAGEPRFEALRALGAVPVAYGEGLADRVRAAVPDGVTVALDAVGTDEALQTSLALVADRDRIATIVRGADADGLGIRAFSGGSPRPLDETEQAWRTEALAVTATLLAAGALQPDEGPVFALADAAAAARAAEEGVRGKIVLRP